MPIASATSTTIAPISATRRWAGSSNLSRRDVTTVNIGRAAGGLKPQLLRVGLEIFPGPSGGDLPPQSPGRLPLLVEEPAERSPPRDAHAQLVERFLVGDPQVEPQLSVPEPELFRLG